MSLSQTQGSGSEHGCPWGLQGCRGVSFLGLPDPQHEHRPSDNVLMN